MFLPDVDPVLADFEERLETATTCAELFGIRDNLDPTEHRRAALTISDVGWLSKFGRDADGRSLFVLAPPLSSMSKGNP